MDRPTTDRWVVAFLHALIAVGALACGWYVHTYITALPIIDEWGFLVEWVDRDSVLQWVWLPHNDHRYPIARFVWIGILTASDYRFDYPQYASVGLMAVAALFAVWTARCLRGRSRLSDAVPVALILNFGHGLSWVMGFQVGFALSIAAAAGWFWCAARLHTGGGWRWAYRSAGFLFVLLGCGGFGLAYGPAAVGWFAFLARRAARLERRREAAHFTVLAVAALGYFIAILFGTTSNIRTGFHPFAEPLEFLGGLGGFLAVGVGDWPISSFGWRPGAVSAAVGLGVAAVYVVGGLTLARRVVKERWEGIFPLAALLTVISTIAVGAAIARTRPDAMLDRYAAFSALGLIALFLARAAAAPVASAARWWRVSVSGGGMLLAAGLFAANVSPGLAVGERFRESALPVLADLNAPLSPLLVGGRHGGTVSVRLGDSFAPILDWLRTSNVPPFSAMPPDPPYLAVPIFPAREVKVVWSVWGDRPRPAPFALPPPPPAAFALQLRFTSDTGVRGRLRLEWRDAATGASGEAAVQGRVTAEEMGHVFPFPARATDLRLIGDGELPHLELREFEWLLSLERDRAP